MNVNALRWELKKSKFFDRSIARRLDDFARVLLSRFGFAVRRDAQASIEKSGPGDKPSRPGQPPHSPTGILPKWIFYAYDSRERSVEIGPYKLNMIFFGRDGEPVKGTVPEALEYGGKIRVLEALFRDVPMGGGRTEDKWIRADLRSRRRLEGAPTRLRTVKIAARPYMEPAYRKNLPRLRQWRGMAA